MLTAILLVDEAPDRPQRRDGVARSLGSLVDACVRGLVADAALVAAPGQGLDALAEQAGCALIEAATPAAGLARALADARRNDILLLRAGFALDRALTDEIEETLAYGAPGRALALRAAPVSLLTRLAPALAEPVGIIAPRRMLQEAASADLRRLARKLRCAALSGGARRTF